MKMFGTIFFACSMFFVVFVLLADSPKMRINRTCTPVTWAGKTLTSAGALAGRDVEMRVAGFADKAHQTCRFFIFRQFYADEYQQALDKVRKAAQKAEDAVSQ
jgi:hypothetical protein